MILCLSFISIDVFSQIVTNVRQYTTAEGLSDNRITCIVKDREGFMWFGTWAGISRFDGRNFLTFKSYPGDKSILKSNRIDEIVEDNSGKFLWLRAYDRQIYRFDKRTQQFFSLADVLRSPAVAKLSFSRILEVQGSNLWVMSDKFGLFQVSNSGSERPGFRLFSATRGADSKISSNHIRFLDSDKRGNMWLGTNSGLNILQRQNDGSFKPTVVPELQDQNCKLIAAATDAQWIVTAAGKIAYVKASGQQVQIVTSSLHPVSYFIVSRSGRAYYSTEAGELYMIDARRKVSMLWKTPNGGPLESIFEDSEGALWLESQGIGVVRFDPAYRSAKYVLSDTRTQINPWLKGFRAFEDKDKSVWIAYNSRLFSYNREKDQLKPFAIRILGSNSLKSENVTKLFYDPSGVLWIGSGWEGIGKYVFQEHLFQYLLPQEASATREVNEVRGLFSYDNKLLFGTKSGDFIMANQENGTLLGSKLSSFNSGVYTILRDKARCTWLGTKGNGLIKISGGLNPIKFTTNAFTSGGGPAAISSNSIYSILQDRRGRLWVGSYEEGLNLMQETNGKISFATIANTFQNYPKSGFRKIRHLAEDKRGLIWAGTTDGLLLFNPKTASYRGLKFKTYKKEPGNIESLGGNDIQFIYPDSRGRVWVLTTTGGLNLALGDDPMKSLSFKNYSTKHGLPSDFLLSCVEDGHQNLWIATQNGLSKFWVDKEKFQNFNAADGLNNAGFSEASAVKMENGSLVFGTTRGLLYFNPDEIQTRKVSAPLVLTNLRINSEDIEPSQDSPLQYSITNTEKIELQHDQNIITLEFSVLDYHTIDKQSYACRLLGFDNVWRSTEGQSRVTYTKLPPGKYTFEVKSLNDELYQNLPFRSLEIIVKPPFYRTWWAYLLYFAAAIAAFGLLRKNALTMLRLRQRVEVERQVADLKVNFFNQISHELRTPLTMIINPAEEIRDQEVLSDKGKGYVEVVLRNAERMLRMVNQVLDLRKVQSGMASLQISKFQIGPFIGKIAKDFQEAISRKKIDLSIEAPDESIMVQADPDKLEIVVYNLLANAIKFSNDNSAIKILIRVSATDSLLISVTDEGPGVTDEELNNIFNLYYEGTHSTAKHGKGTGIGLALARELVKLHGGQIYAVHNRPAGLCVKLDLPILAGETIRDNSLENFASDGTVCVKSGDKGEGHKEVAAEGKPVLLVVEDNDDLRNFLKNKFYEDYKVEAATDGEEGLQAAIRLLPNLILSDIMMPNKDGIQMLDELKHNPLTSHIPVILLSARYSVESQMEGLKYGADYYMSKPFNWKLLKTAVDSIIARRQDTFRKIRDNEDNPATDQSITEYDKKFLEKLVQIVEDKLNDPEFNIDEVAASMSMSRSAFYRKFKSLTNLAPIEFVRETRLKKAKMLFDAGEDNVSVVAYTVGFTSPKYFTSCFKNQYQKTPTDYLKSIRKPRTVQ